MGTEISRPTRTCLTRSLRLYCQISSSTLSMSDDGKYEYITGRRSVEAYSSLGEWYFRHWISRSALLTRIILGITLNRHVFSSAI